MAFVTRDGVRLYWRADGRPDRPALLMLNSLGTDHAMWDAVTPALARDFCVLRMDTRGHGASDAPEGDYSIAMLAADALAVLDAAGATQAHICGLSMGGMTALEIAATRPGRVMRVVAANTSPRMDAAAMRERAALVRRGGMAPWPTASSAASSPRASARRTRRRWRRRAPRCWRRSPPATPAAAWRSPRWRSRASSAR
jgi:3-oxoadipate enol-lactonase/4-carboxymuconolactone decarboxylase